MYPQQPYSHQPYQPYPQQGPGQNGWPSAPGGPSTRSYSQPTTQPPWPPLPPGPVKKRQKWPWVVGVLVALILILIIAAAGSRGTTSSPQTAATSSPTANSAPRSNAQQAAAPTRHAAAPRAISARDWAKIAKEPDAHVGEAIIVYGEVTQFDSVTGSDTFRANVDGVKHSVSYGFADYPTNTILTNESADLGDIVQDDLFKAEVVVAGSLSYETTLGGSTTVPKLTVLKISVIGSTK
jgi:hypothetical protein